MMNINELIKEAMHKKDMQRLGVLKLIKTEFLKKATEPGRKSKDLTEEEQIKVLMKMAAQHKDSIEQYTAGGRKDLADSEKSELDVIESFLPKEATTEEVKSATEEAINSYLETKENSYKLSMKDMKSIFNIVKTKYPTANGGVVSKTLKDIIEKQH